MKKSLVILLLLVSSAGFMGFKLQLDTFVRAKEPGGSFIYIPKGKFMHAATFGFSSLAADIIYLWAIQYFSDQSIPDRYQHLDHVFGIIAELDPHYLDPYEIGAVISVYEARDFEACFKILDRGLEKNPDQWIFPFQAGHYAQMRMNDHDLAREYFKKTMEIAGAPSYVPRLYANTFFNASDYQAALKHWWGIYREAEAAGDKQVVKIADNHIYKNMAAIDIERIKAGLDAYRRKSGSNPDNLQELVAAGIMREIPKDFDGNDYHYDPQTGEVSSEIWWKR